ncbi:MAG: carboxypeptidase-like regulatory domain-containing protein [Bacteroidia bacterium]
MKTFFLIASGIMSLFFSMNMDTNPPLPEVASQAQMQVISDCEEEPIILRGHIRGTGGIVVPFGQVVLKKLGQSIPSHTATSDSNGDYTIAGIEAGVYKLGITASGYQPKVVTVTIVDDLERSDTLIAQ